MLRSLDLEELAHLVETAYQRKMTSASSESGNAATERVRQAAMGILGNASHNVYMLMRYLLDFELQVSQHPASGDPGEDVVAKTAQQTTSRRPSRILEAIGGVMSNEARQHHARLTGCIEIYNAKGTLRQYFVPIPRACLMLLDGHELALPGMPTHNSQPPR